MRRRIDTISFLDCGCCHPRCSSSSSSPPRCCQRASSHSLSPCTVASTFLLCFPSLNSKNHMPCQVPSANLPFVMGIETLAPMREDLMCACSCQMKVTCRDAGSNVQAYHRSPLHHACRFPCQLAQVSRHPANGAMSSHGAFQVLKLPPSPTSSQRILGRERYLCPPPQSCPSYRSCPS